MCRKPDVRRTETDRAQTRQERPIGRRQWQNTRPRGNGPREQRELARGIEKLTAVLGH